MKQQKQKQNQQHLLESITLLESKHFGNKKKKRHLIALYCLHVSLLTKNFPPDSSNTRCFNLRDFNPC